MILIAQDSYTVNKGSGYTALRIASDGDGTNNNNTIVIETYGYGGSSDLNFTNGNWGGGYFFKRGSSGGIFNQVRIIHGGGGGNGPLTGFGILDVYGTNQSIGARISGSSNSYIMNGNFGIGLTSANERLSVKNNLSVIGSSNLAKLVIESNDDDVSIDITARKNNTVTNQPGRDIRWFTKQNQELSMILNKDGKLGIGTSDFSGNHKLRVEGSIGAREIKVEASGWSDFVFYDDYELRTLEEVEQHIKDKGHLPEIPNEAEVTKNGINLGEMNAKLLQKIEELTLYLIEQNKKIEALEQKVKTLEKD